MVRLRNQKSKDYYHKGKTGLLGGFQKQNRGGVIAPRHVITVSLQKS